MVLCLQNGEFVACKGNSKKAIYCGDIGEKGEKDACLGMEIRTENGRKADTGNAGAVSDTSGRERIQLGISAGIPQGIVASAG